MLDERKRKKARLVELLIANGWNPPRPSSEIVARIAESMVRIDSLAENSIPKWQPKLRLTPSETRVLAYAAAGYSIPHTAELLGRGAETIKSQRKAAIEKLGARNTTHAVAIAIRAGVIE